MKNELSIELNLFTGVRLTKSQVHASTAFWVTETVLGVVRVQGKRHAALPSESFGKTSLKTKNIDSRLVFFAFRSLLSFVYSTIMRLQKFAILLEMLSFKPIHFLPC